MAETVVKKVAKAVVEKRRWGRPKDVQRTESKASYYARKYMRIHSARSALKERD